jgi:hypothetical protein
MPPFLPLRRAELLPRACFTAWHREMTPRSLGFAALSPGFAIFFHFLLDFPRNDPV